MQLFGDISAERFFADYWQQQPLLIRQAFPGLASPISADELAGLACEPEVESRIIQGQADKHDWRLSHGPFTEQQFQQMPDSHWTLLVQAADHWHPDVHQLLNRFRFLPAWRLDDIMVSFAADGGSVGPHFDDYDVFLLQTEGKRHWQWGPRCDANSPLLPHPDLRLLPAFEPEQEALLEPGDMLYLPPRVAHHGVAVGPCITCSIGFRAPRVEELLGDMADYISAQDQQFAPLRDRLTGTTTQSGAVTEQGLSAVRALIEARLHDDAWLQNWFGHYFSTPKYGPAAYTDGEDDTALADLRQRLLHANQVTVMPGARLLYTADPSALFANGERWPLDQPMCAPFHTLCDQGAVPAPAFHALLDHPGLLNLLVDLYAMEAITFSEDD